MAYLTAGSILEPVDADKRVQPTAASRACSVVLERTGTLEPCMEEHIRQLEERLLQPQVRTSAEQVATLLAPEFIEFGSSGRILTRPQIIKALQCEEPVRRSLEEFKTTLLAPGVALATYRAVRYAAGGEHPIRSLRSSIWKFIDGRWQMVFHQGTVLGEPS